MPKPESNSAPRRRARSTERRAQRPAAIDAVQLYDLVEAAAALSKSRAGLYLDLEAGRIKAIHDGRRRKILGAELIAYAAQLAGGAA